MENGANLTPLLLVVVLAFAVPLLMARFRHTPVVLGEILAGVVIGRSGLNIITQGETLSFLSTIGLAFLMFLAGMEIDFERLLRGVAIDRSRKGLNPLLAGFLGYLLTLALAVPGGFLLSHLGLQADPWLMAFILSATSLGVLLPVLKERDLLNQKVGEVAFYAAILADFITVLLFTLYVILRERGPSLDMLSVVLLFAVFFLFSRLGQVFFRLQRFRQVFDRLSHVTVQIKVRGAIAILMVFVVLAGILGLEAILGAFLAGMVISLLNIPEDTDLVSKLEAFGFGFFIPLFFILVGANLDLRVVLQSPRSLAVLPVMLIASLLVKVVPSLLYRRVVPWRQALAASILLNTHLSLEIAVAVIGLQLHLLDPAANTLIILFAVLTVFLMPTLFNSVLPRQPEEAESIMALYGADDLALKVATALHHQGQAVTLITPEPALAAQGRAEGLPTLQVSTLEAGLAQLKDVRIPAALAVTPNDELNYRACLQALDFGVEHVVALVNEARRLPDFRSLGVMAFSPALFRPNLLALMARNPDFFDLLTTTTENREVAEVTIRQPYVVGRQLRDISLPSHLLVLSVRRGSELIIPHGSTRFELGDRLTLMGSPEELDEAASMLE